MVSLPALWLPILLSAVAVFVLSSLIHMVLQYHRSDYTRLPMEDEVMAVLGRAGVVPGNEYIFPYAGSPAAMKDPAYVEKRMRGPAGLISVMPTGMGNMGSNMAVWFLYNLVVSLFAGYLTSRALRPGAESAEVLRFSSTVAFLGYGMALVQQSIWWNRKWSTTTRNLIDALIYAAATGAIFVWLWPAT